MYVYLLFVARSSMSTIRKREEKHTVHFFFLLILIKHKTRVLMTIENEYIIWTSNNNKSITMPTTMCLEIGDKRRNAYRYIYFFFSWALELVLLVGAPYNIHSFLFFLLKKMRAYVNDFLFSVSLLDSRTYCDYYPHHCCVLTCCFCVCKI